MTTTTQQLIATKDIRTNVKCPGLMSRKIWQLLFNEYKDNGGDLSYMDSLLCDLHIIETMIEKAQWHKDNPFTFYWDFSTSWTEITSYDIYKYQIDLEWDEIKLFKTTVEV